MLLFLFPASYSPLAGSHSLPQLLTPPRLILVPVNLDLPVRRPTQTSTVYYHLPDTF